MTLTLIVWQFTNPIYRWSFPIGIFHSFSFAVRSFNCRHVQLLLAAEVTRRVDDRRVRREGNGALAQRQVPVLPAAARTRSAAGTGPAPPSGVAPAQHALPPAHLSVRRRAPRTPRPHRPAADTASAEGVSQGDAVLHRALRHGGARPPVLLSWLVRHGQPRRKSRGEQDLEAELRDRMMMFVDTLNVFITRQPFHSNQFARRHGLGGLDLFSDDQLERYCKAWVMFPFWFMILQMMEFISLI